MKLTKNIISREEALKLVPDYVTYIERYHLQLSSENRCQVFDKMIATFEKMKRGQKCITFCDGVYLKVKVSKVDSTSYMAVDGPVIRVSNGEYSWRVDGDGYAFPI